MLDALAALMVKQATYEKYLRDSSEYQKSLKQTISETSLEAANAKKELLNHRIEISEIQTSLGLDDQEADQNRKIIEREKLVGQKQELEKKLRQLEAINTVTKVKRDLVYFYSLKNIFACL